MDSNYDEGKKCRDACKPAEGDSLGEDSSSLLVVLVLALFPSQDEMKSRRAFNRRESFCAPRSPVLVDVAFVARVILPVRAAADGPLL